MTLEELRTHRAEILVLAAAVAQIGKYAGRGQELASRFSREE
jgi:hypothetical protein